jgi:predicted transcriptional regulator
MAENQILVKFTSKGDKELINAINRLATAQKKLESGLKNVDNANKKTSKSAGVLDTRNKRLAETNGMLANSFATVRSKMLLWSFAMSLGIRQIAQMAQEAANLKGMEAAFNTLAGGTDSATVAIDKLRDATNNTMSDFDLFQQANNAMILGVSKNSDEMAEMFDIAQRLGNALGKDTRMSVESLITGIGRQSRLMLDNIGLIVKSEEAYEAYAEALGKSKDELTDSEKKQAFLNATMISAREKVKTLNEETDTARTSFQQLTAAAENLQGRLGDAANAFEPLIGSMTKFLDLITDERIDRFVRSIKFMGETLKVVGVILGGLFVGALVYMFGVVSAGATIVGLLTSAFASLASTLIGKVAILGTFSYGVVAVSDAIKEAINPTVELTKEQKRLNKEFKEGAVTLADEDIGSSYETLAEEMLRFGSSVETVTNSLFFHMQAQDIVREMYGKTKEGQLEAIDAQIATIDFLGSEIGLTNELAAVLAMLEERKRKILGVDENGNEISNKKNKLKKTELELLKEEIKLATQRAVAGASANEHLAASAVRAAGQVMKAKLAVAVAELVEDAFSKLGWLGVPLAASAGAVVGSIFQGGINTIAGGVEKFEDGGLIGGRRHSQGGTMINAEQGEFVMSRNAVEAIGVENLNRMNQGGSGAVNITFTGNVMSQDFIENEAIPQIKDAIRRGADIGVS